MSGNIVANLDISRGINAQIKAENEFKKKIKERERERERKL